MDDDEKHKSVVCMDAVMKEKKTRPLGEGAELPLNGTAGRWQHFWTVMLTVEKEKQCRT